MEKLPIPKLVLSRLQEHFDILLPRNLFLIKPNTYVDRVYHVFGSTSVKGNIKISFRIVQDEGYICDYFLNGDGYTEHRRYNIDTNEVELLDNFEGQFGNSEFEDEDIDYEEHRRILKHNNEIRKMLIKKGFLKK